MRHLWLIILLALAGSAGAADLLTVKDLAARLASDSAPAIIDVRAEEAYLQGHIPGAAMIPSDHVSKYVDLLYGRNKEPIALYGKGERDARVAADALESAGFKRIMILLGGFDAWAEAGQPVTPLPEKVPAEAPESAPPPRGQTEPPQAATNPPGPATVSD